MIFLSVGLIFISKIVSKWFGSVLKVSFCYSTSKIPTDPFMKETKNNSG